MPSKKDQTIQKCINALVDRKELDKQTQTYLIPMIERGAKKSFWNWSAEFLAQLAGPNFAPQAILKTADKLGMITHPEHRKFMTKYRMLIAVEANLLSIAHINPVQFGDFIKQHQKASLEDRLQAVTQLAGGTKTIRRLQSLIDREHKINAQSQRENNPVKQKRILERRNRNYLQIQRITGQIATNAQMRIDHQLRRNPIAELQHGLAHPEQHSRRDLELFQRYLDRHYARRNTR